MTKTTRDLRLSAALLAAMLAMPVASWAESHGGDDDSAMTEDHGTAAAAPSPQETAPVVGKEALDQVVGTVGDTQITVGHMIVAKASLPQQYQSIPDEQLWDSLLEQLIQQEVLAQSGDAKETPLVRLSLENESRSLMAAVAITAVADRAVNDDRITDIYKRDYVDVEQGKEFNASHILLESEEEALAVLEEVKGGAEFAQVAREKSTGPSGPNGGSLGWFSSGMMVEPFQVAVDSMAPGDVTGPIETQFGWHVIKLNDTRSLTAPSLEDVRAEIVQKVQQEAVEKHIDDLMRKTDVSRAPQISVDPSILSQTDLLEN
ncbi:peptidyl-prolyl cis-trans isomerase C [Sagittula marina]|uniref:Parvulin-like PPIase n=1 Tax=Sagittula marina TaxID=943940 RepID=A0A7W6DPP6_9RHOB|nr:peptidylprolyl isomerase [Sagittula marina]MBB3986499.1 peptidyl-prolyl cis-trans isomerase C [Sagittula marina]